MRIKFVGATLAAAMAVSIAAPVAAQARAGNAGAANASHAAEHAVCAPQAPGFARCHAHVRDTPGGLIGVQASAPQGYAPAALQSAYNVPWSSTGSITWSKRPLVAIVDAYDDPYAEKDLQIYRKQYGLPVCTSSNGCFKKVSQSGSTKRYPTANSSWAEEISLDVDMVSAMCPDCRILLVEASSARFSDLATAVNTAKSLHATVVSNSYGGTEFSSETSYDTYYGGVPMTVSTGDSGYGVQYPAASPNVTAVGGTSLVDNGNGTFSESAWSGAGSGCSAYEKQPGFQANAGTGCSNRAVADVSAVADPNTGVAVYDTYLSSTSAGWLVFGGTSVAAPVVASLIARAGTAYTAATPYGHTTSLNDVTSGSNGTCLTAQWCTAGNGWDGPTGLGTPNGLGAF